MSGGSGAFDAGSIVSHLKLDLSEFKHGIAEGSALGAGFAEILTHTLESAVEHVTEAFKESAKFLRELIDETANHERQIGLQAQALGVSTEFLDGWGRAAQRVGGSADEVSELIGHLTRAITEAAGDKTSDAAKAFKGMGIALKEAGGQFRPVESVMRDVSDALAGMDAGWDRNIASQKLFGRAGTATLQFLAQGSGEIDGYVDQLRQMGAVTTRASAQASADWVNLEHTLGDAWEGMRMQLAEPIRETLTPMLQNVVKWVEDHPAQIKATIKDLADGISAAFNALGQAFGFVVEHFDEIKAGMRGVVDGFKMVYDVAAAVTEATIKLDHAIASVFDRTVAPVNRLFNSPIVSAVSAGAAMYGGSGGGGGNTSGGSGGSSGGNGQGDGKPHVFIGGEPVEQYAAEHPEEFGGASGKGGGATFGDVNIVVQGGPLGDSGADHAGRQLTDLLKKHTREQKATAHGQSLKKNITGR